MAAGGAGVARAERRSTGKGCGQRPAHRRRRPPGAARRPACRPGRRTRRRWGRRPAGAPSPIVISDATARNSVSTQARASKTLDGATGQALPPQRTAAVEAPGVDAEEQRATGGDQAGQDRHRRPRQVAEDRHEAGADRQHQRCRGASAPSARPSRGRCGSACPSTRARQPAGLVLVGLHPRPRRAASAGRRGARGPRRARPRRGWPPSRTATTIHHRAPQPLTATLERDHRVGNGSSTSVV